LADKIDRQHSRLEGLLRELLGTPVVKSNLAVQLLPVSGMTLPETSMAAAVRVALASEPCPPVSFKDDDKVEVPRSGSDTLQSIPSAAKGANQNVPDEGNMDVKPMDMEGVTHSVENVIIAVGGTDAGGGPVRSEADVYDMVDVSVTKAPAVKLPDLQNEVCTASLLPRT